MSTPLNDEALAKLGDWVSCGDIEARLSNEPEGTFFLQHDSGHVALYKLEGNLPGDKRTKARRMHDGAYRHVGYRATPSTKILVLGISNGEMFQEIGEAFGCPAGLRIDTFLLSIAPKWLTMEKELVDAKKLATYKDETATGFMNQVKGLQAEVAALRAGRSGLP